MIPRDALVQLCVWAAYVAGLAIVLTYLVLKLKGL